VPEVSSRNPLTISIQDQLHTFSLSQLLQTTMFTFTTCQFVLFSLLSLSANAETIRGAHRELEATVPLQTAGDFAILAQTGITSTGATSINDDIAVSPIGATAMTGFDLVMNTNNQYSTSTKVVAGGKVYASDYMGTTPTTLSTAVGHMVAAYEDAEGRDNTNQARIELGAGILGGGVPGSPGTAAAPLTPGVYTFSTGVLLTGDLHFSSDGIYIIQIAQTLTQHANMRVILHDAQAKNIFWQVVGAVTVGADAHMEGTILAKTAVTFITGSSLNGRVLAQTMCALQQTTITVPAL
jgi:hypothetical protein